MSLAGVEFVGDGANLVDVDFAAGGVGLDIEGVRKLWQEDARRGGFAGGGFCRSFARGVSVEDLAIFFNYGAGQDKNAELAAVGDVG